MAWACRFNVYTHSNLMLCCVSPSPWPPQTITAWHWSASYQRSFERPQKPWQCLTFVATLVQHRQSCCLEAACCCLSTRLQTRDTCQSLCYGLPFTGTCVCVSCWPPLSGVCTHVDVRRYTKMILYAADQADVLVNARGPEGVTPLLLACQYAQMGSISTLLDLVHHTPHPTHRCSPKTQN